MHTRHKDELLLRLERLADLGTCQFRAAEFRQWFNRERLTKTVWAEILEHWNEIDDHDGNRIMVGFQEGTYTFVFNPEDDWWGDLGALAGMGE